MNREVPRLVDALPNGPRGFATVQVFLAGGVPEVMLALRSAGLLDTRVKTVSGDTLDASLDWWRDSERRQTLRRKLKQLDGIDADDVIMSPDRARDRGLTATVCFPVGNLAPEGAVIKSTAIDPSLIGEDNVYSPSRSGARVYDRSGCDRGDQSGPDRAWRRDCADLQRPQGRGDAGDLPGDIGAQATAALQACRRADGCAL